jgi:hypothetical protein
MTDRLTIRCAACNSDQFKGVSSNPQPDDVITCAGCGATSRYVEIQRQAVEQGTKAVETAVRNAFKGIKGFKFK